MNFSSKDIIEIYSYTEDEQETFKYLRKYMKLIKPKLPEIKNDKGKFKRFALIGLFLTYRAGNHTGSDITTEGNFTDTKSVHTKRIKAIKEVFNTRILCSRDYLRMINFSFLDFILVGLRIKNVSKKFYKFVVNG